MQFKKTQERWRVSGVQFESLAVQVCSGALSAGFNFALTLKIQGAQSGKHVWLAPFASPGHALSSHEGL